MSVEIRLTTECDSIAAAELLRDSMEPHLRPYMPLTQRGAYRYIGAVATHGPIVFSRFSLCAVLDDRLIGFAEFRMPTDGLAFLSYICVAPAARGLGLARDLVRAGLDLMPDASELALDVFDHNVSARALYERLGFKQSAAPSHWTRRKLPPPSTQVAIPDMHEVLATLSCYGFANIEFAAEPGERFGLLGDHLVRANTDESFANVARLANLRSVFPRRKHAFATLSDRSCDDNHQVFASSRRMSAAVSRVLAACGPDNGPVAR